MKLMSFSVNNKERYGLWVEDGVVDLQPFFPQYKTLRELIPYLHLIDESMLAGKKADYVLSEITFLPVITDPRKIICAGMNYQEKRAEFNQQERDPTLFIRFADSQTGHLTHLLKPTRSREFDYEGEMALVIGRGGANIPESRALEHVAGYSCYLDGSVRDWQHSWFTAGKNWPRIGGFGPWLVTADAIPDPQNLRIVTRLNGKIVQEDTTGSMVHSIAELIAYISTFSPLSPGDVILTGSPGGVGKKRTPPLFMYPGDTVEVEIEHIGCLIHPVGSDAISVTGSAQMNDSQVC